MKNFEFKSQICTSRSQSEKLLALGLKKETADCALFLNGNNEFEQLSNFGDWERYADMFPAWSLHRLLQIINRDIVIKPYTTFDDIIADIEGLIKTQLIDWRYLEEDK
jgi:hypothetical protein